MDQKIMKKEEYSAKTYREQSKFESLGCCFNNILFGGGWPNPEYKM